jgi:hypothetical protein
MKNFQYNISKTVIFIFSFLFISSFWSCEEEQSFKKTENIQVIPHNAALIIEGRKLSKIKESVEEQEIGKLISGDSHFNTFFSDLNKLDRKMKSMGTTFWKSIDFSYSLHPTGAKNFSQLLIFEDKKQKIFTGIKEAFSAEEMIAKPYDKQEVFEIKSLNLYMVLVDKFLVLSNKEILVKDAIRQYTADADLPSDAEFNKVFQSANRSELMNIYVHSSKLYEIIEMVYGKSFSVLSDFKEWMSFDIDIQDDNLFLTGMSTIHTDDPFYFLMKDKKHQKSTVDMVLPSNTKFFVSKLFPDFNVYLQSRLHTLERQLKFEQYKEFRKKEKFNQDALTATLGSEFTYAICGTDVEQLNSLLVATITELENKDLFIGEELLDYRGEKIYSYKHPKLLYYFYGDLFKNFKEPKVLFLDDFMIVSDELAQLKTVVNDFRSGNNLANQKNYADVKSNAKSKSNVFTYISKEALELFPMQLATEKNKEQQEQVGEKLAHLGNIIAQIDVEDNYLQWTLVSKSPKSEKKVESLKSLWSVELEQPFTQAPTKVWNHKTKKYELVIQDIARNLYWISMDGKIRWSYTLEEDILGQPKQIDIYKNGRKQILFNTKSQVYLLDLNGKIVDGYPVKLPSEATAGLSVFDYDNNKNYRTFVPCKNHLLVLDRLGKRVTGWKNYNQKSEIVSEIEYLNQGGKDYILVENATGLKILNRQGKERISLKDKLRTDLSGKWTVSSKGFKRFGNSEIITIDFKGNINRTNHQVEDVLGFINHGNHEVFITKEQIKQYKGYEYSFTNEAYKPLYSLDPATKFLALCEPALEELIVLDEYGKLKDNFPVFGTTKPLIATMNNKQFVYAFVGGKDGTLYAYQIVR